MRTTLATKATQRIGSMKVRRMRHISIGLLALLCAFGANACGATLVQPFRSAVEFRSGSPMSMNPGSLAPAPLAYVAPTAPAPAAYSTRASSR